MQKKTGMLQQKLMLTKYKQTIAQDCGADWSNLFV